MKKIGINLSALLVLGSLLLAACQPAAVTDPQANAGQSTGLKVLVVESFLADIAQNVAGDRLQVQTLMPIGLDPHAFEPTPQDVAKIAESQVLIVNGAGFEEWLSETLANAGGERRLIEASTGLSSRQPRAGEIIDEHHSEEGDPHFWLDPNHVIQYVENIRAGLTAADPQGADLYAQNAAAYVLKLQDLDTRIKQQVAGIPAERRLMVTNHESFGYFADRYGFQITGAIIPSTSSGAAPSAQEMAVLIDHIRQAGAPAIFLETGANPKLAEQIAQETGIKVVGDLYTHSITAAGGAAPSYIAMIEHNVSAIVEALK